MDDVGTSGIAVFLADDNVIVRQVVAKGRNAPVASRVHVDEAEEIT
jgi:hypothetical protein